MGTLLDLLRERVVVFDGAMGTQIHAADLDLDEYWGQEGNSEVLNLSRPDVIGQIHANYFAAGADCVETNTFGANLVVQAEYDFADKVHELNVAAARIAREAASSFTDKPRFVVGSIGPGTKLPTLGNATFAELERSYTIQVDGLMEGGVDALIIETCQDLLQTKTAIAACQTAFAKFGRKVPLIVQVTIETTGTMLVGSDISAALASLEPYREIDVVGLNCATGPVEMLEHVRYLTRHSRRPVSVQPNAGLPEIRDGATYYPLQPKELVSHLETFVDEFGVSIVGGCCGTTPEYIRGVSGSMSGRTPKARTPDFVPSASSLYTAQPFAQDNSVFVIGERCNTNGSRKFKELIAADDFESMVRVASHQVREGAHALDVCVDFTGRNGVPDMEEVGTRFATQVTLPLVVDSTEPPVIEAAFRHLGGRPILNSINLEEGTGPETRLAQNLALARKYGAAVIAGAIEEKGQATTADWKLDVCRRLLDVCLEAGLEPHDVIYDTLALPISTGMEEARRYGIETLDSIERVKKELPGTFTALGISNVSFGLNPAGRQVLNSVYLDEAVKRGLDMAIVSPAQILPLARIPEEQREVALEVIYDKRREGYDPLQRYLELFEGASVNATATADELATLPLEERLARRIVDAARKGLEEDLTAALEVKPALDIVNDWLLEGMKVVSARFGSGEMQLPFVLQSAETMKKAVAFLEPHMEKTSDAGKGTLVLATVKGDVHDIGKNLVDIILSNNGYTVINIGIKQAIADIISAAEEHKADAIGMSGLLVKSTLVMRENLEELNRRTLQTPVLLGGAALTRSYVEHDLRAVYGGDVFYGKDAFEGLRHMDAIMAFKRGETTVTAVAAAPARRKASSRTEARGSSSTERSPEVSLDVDVPTAPFFGTRVVKGIPIPEIAKWLNRTALFRGRWQYSRRKGQTIEQYTDFLANDVESILREGLARCVEEQILQPAVVYGYFRVRSEGNDLVVLREDGSEWVRWTLPRQPAGRKLAIPDFFRGDGTDVLPVHLVTMGSKISDVAQELFESDNYTDYLHLHGLGVEMAEALAEMWHARIREELGIGADDAPTMDEIFKQGYRGSRYSFGYPACPDLEGHVQLFELLEPGRIGVDLSDEFQLVPEQSTSALIVHHPQAKYFTIQRSAEPETADLG
jgi:5-methyltetrahydrofolate--homocysteine methyltransferase